MIGWTGFRSDSLYFVIGVISTLVLLFRIFNKPPAGGVRCWAICISILISSFIPILFYDKGIFKIVSADNTGLSTLFDLTSYFPYSNFNELVRFNVESAAKWILGIVVFRFLCSTFCSQDNAIRSLFIRSWIFGVLASITAQLLQYLNNFPSIWLFAYDYLAFNGRFPGLSDHPNTISIIVCISVPLLYFSGLQKRHQRYILFLFFISELLAQSRIGIATFILTLVLCEWRALHKKFSFALVFIFGAILILLLYKLSLFNSIIESSRFNPSNIDTQQSNSGRWILMRFGWNTFLENPVFGVGPRAFKENHNIYIQVLASLGFFGLIGFFDFLIRPLLLKYGRDLEPFLAKICLLAFMFVGLFNNKLTDFYLYFPLMLSLQILLSNKKNQEFELGQAHKS
jgi:O-antigen ligase